MAGPLLGRNARIIVNGTTITRAIDISVTDEAEDAKLTPRLQPYAVHLPSGKDLIVTFQKLGESGADYTLLQTAFITNAQDLVVMIVRDATQASQTALRFVGCCLKFNEAHPKDGVATTDVVLAITGLDGGPTRVTWTNPA